MYMIVILIFFFFFFFLVSIEFKSTKKTVIYRGLSGVRYMKFGSFERLYSMILPAEKGKQVW